MMLDLSQIENLYAEMSKKHDLARQNLGRSLTLSEKILFGHLINLDKVPKRGKSYVELQPDRVAMQDATAQMALLQFALTGRSEVAVPSTVHCDHLIQARVGRDSDLADANKESSEVFSFLKSASAKYGAGFWEPGAGIIHQVVLENYAFPGGMMIGTDSHTPNAGGLGMVAIGVGGADAMEVMAGLPFTIRWPGVIGVHLTGKLSGWSSPKDVILKVCEELTVKGGTSHIVEYFGPGASSISCTGKGTICNMGAEVGATTSLFPYDDSMARYLDATGRSGVSELAAKHSSILVADPEVLENPENFYDRIIEINLSELEPMIVGPHTPDLARSVSDLGQEAKDKGWPTDIQAALIGSCTNSSYEDMERAASVARQAKEAGIKSRVQFMVTPGSDTIDQTIRRDGQMQLLDDIGGTVLANACGPCIGQWKREDVSKGDVNSIVSSYNRNFSGRNDGNHQTLSFLTSPEIVTAMALAGSLDFNPQKDKLTAADGTEFSLEPPTGSELPANGFESSLVGFVPPLEGNIDLDVSPTSRRLQLLEPFEAITKDDLTDIPLLVKVKGKCTTDHISPAGIWLQFRGHLDNISDNCYIGAHNSFTEEQGTAINQLDGSKGKLPKVARKYYENGQGWAVVADVNYGEGSSREHAAMSPRFLGCKVVIARSMARIAETNLKKQGVLPLTFDNESSWDLLRVDDRLTIKGTDELGPNSKITVEAKHSDGTIDTFVCNHSMDDLQVEWFKSGSALNYLRSKN
ncbi:MAG: aconitate hydratase [Marine Group III euryarchaeote CG-Epi2]|uniref:aconitate hydratase n=1 Tax=Marine Group III euryarchaeote CG-Epi2 TaxID=1888996 RepID=A0A1J5TPK2_9ARCH|nr:MAG: aconitate hydratase [Marine Group III euryarchaeote CG-Epi2]